MNRRPYLVRAGLLMTAPVVASLVTILVAQTPPTPPPPRDAQVRPVAGTAVISGVVVSDEATPAPVRRARVTVRSEAYGNGWSATTDDDGRFVVRGIPAGQYTVQATKPAWLAANYGAIRPGRPGTPIAVADGARVQGLTLRMSRGGVIAGIVIDRAGQPVPGVSVAAMRYGFSDVTGERTLSRATGSDFSTDDQGAYRYYGLAPGDYVIAATLRLGGPTASMDLQRMAEGEVARALAEARSGTPARPATAAATNAQPPALVGYAPVYFPGTSDLARAAAVRIGAAEERTGVNISIDVVPTARVEAVPAFPDNANRQTLQVYLVSQQPVSLGAASMTTGRRDAEGRVVFSGVTPGAYTVIARAAIAADPANPSAPPAAGRGRAGTAPLTLYATTDIVVDGQDLVVPLNIATGATLSGRVTFDDAASAPKDAAISVSLTPVKSGPALSVSAVPVDASGAFRFVGVPAGTYRVNYTSARTLDSWRLVSATVGSLEALDAPLEIRAGTEPGDLVMRFTNRPSELAGRLQTSGGQPAPAFSIVIFSAERNFWTPLSRRVRQLRPASDGAFSVRGLPAGEYYIAALTDVEPGEWYDPGFLAQLVPTAAKVTVRDGERTLQDLMIR